MRLFSAAGCPFAQRTRALLALVGAPFELREIDLSAKPPDFLALSPTGRVPLLEDDGFLLYESAIINEYLTDRFKWNGLSADPRIRARERLAILQFDQVINPVFWKTLKTPAAELEPTVHRELEQLAITATSKPVESLLGLHLAPFWLRWNWLAPENPLVRHTRATNGLGEWLDAAVAQPAIQQTAPDREECVRQLRAKFG